MGTDAVNVNQLTAVSNSAVKYDKNPDGSINYNSVTLNPGGSLTTMTNLAAGDISQNSKDAVNGSQLYQTNQTVSTLGNNAASVIGGGASYDPSTGQMTGPTFSIAGGKQTNLSDAINALNQGWNVTTGGNTSGASVTAVQPGSTVTFNGGKNIALAQNGADITIATSDTPTFTSVGIDNGGPTLSGSGLNMAGKKITNVATGDVSSSSKDAVNGSQLYQTNQTVSTLGNNAASVIGGGASYDPSTGQMTGPTFSIAGGKQTNLSDAINALNQGWNVTTGGNTSGASVTAVQPGSTVTFNGGKNIALAQNGADITIATSDTPTFTSVGIDNGGPTLSGSGLNMAGKKITNVAAGEVSSSSADAINGSQLYQVEQAQQQANDQAVKYDKNPDGSINYSSVTLNPGGSPTTMTNLAAGNISQNSKDAVNGSQLYQTNQTVSTLGNNAAAVIGGGASYDPSTGQMTGPTFSIAGGKQTNLSDAINALNQGWNVTTGGNTSGSSVTAVQPGSTVTFNGGKNIALTQNGADITIATSDTPTFTSVGIDNGGPTLSGSGLNMAGKKITNVATGDVSSSSTDAINGSQLYQVEQAQQQANDQAVKYDKNPDGSINYNSVTLGGTPSTDGGKTGGTKLSNLAQGDLSEKSADAVNGAQLYQTNQNVANLGQQVANISNGGGIKYFHANGGTTNSLPDSQAVGAGSAAIGPGATAAGDTSVAIGNNASAKRDGDVALGSGSVADRGAEKYTGKYSGAQNDTAGTVSVGASGQERTISNVADGKEATDAVNLRQLDGAVQAANGYTNQQVKDVQGSVANVTNNVQQLQSDMSSVKTGSAGMFQTGQDDATAPRASGKQSTAGGAGAVASGNSSTALGNGAKASSNDSVALGARAQASGSNSLALGAGSVADRNNSVSVGAPGHERQITNVAPGTAPTDAVNLGQLNVALNQTAGQLQQGINDTARKAYSGVAAATALTMIPDVDKDKVLSVGVGVGSYQGYSAVALGATARITENIKMRAGASLGGSGTAIGMGASMQW